MIEVSRARFNEIAEVVRYARHAHESSNWSWAPFSAAKFRKSLLTMMRRPDFAVLLARNPDICGILIGSIDEMIQSNVRYAVDIEFFADRGGAELIDEFKRWAKDQGVKAILMADSNGGRDDVKARFYRMKGFENTGGVYSMRLTD